MEVDKSPPWVLFTDKGKPVAILPAGRPGEVMSVRGMSLKEAHAIVNAGNAAYQQTVRDRIVRLRESFAKLTKILKESAEPIENLDHLEESMFNAIQGLLDAYDVDSTDDKDGM